MEIVDKNTSKIVDEIFVSLQAIFPAFKQAWPTQFEIDEAKYHWIKAFVEAGLNDVCEIEEGIKNCRALKKSFVPSAGEFIGMCRQKETKVPYHKPYVPELPKAISTKETAIKHLKDIKSLLGK